MKALWVAVAASEGVHSVESAIGRIVVTCAEVIHLQVIIILLACVEQSGQPKD